MNLISKQIFAACAMIAFAIIASCNITDTVYAGFKTIPGEEWQYNEPVIFDNLPFDTLQPPPSTAQITIRHTNEYPYRNLWLFISYHTNDGDLYADTVEYQLSDLYGKWNGKGFGSSYEFTAPFVPRKARLNTLTRIAIKQGMRDNPLPGISDVGIAVKN